MPAEQAQPVQRILVVAAHPDDVDFGSAGTIATWTDAGIEVFYCIATDGDAGGFDPQCPARRSPVSGRMSSARRPPPWASRTSSSSATPTASWS